MLCRFYGFDVCVFKATLRWAFVVCMNLAVKWNRPSNVCPTILAHVELPSRRALTALCNIEGRGALYDFYVLSCCSIAPLLRHTMDRISLRVVFGHHVVTIEKSQCAERHKLFSRGSAFSCLATHSEPFYDRHWKRVVCNICLEMK